MMLRSSVDVTKCSTPTQKTTEWRSGGSFCSRSSKQSGSSSISNHTQYSDILAAEVVSAAVVVAAAAAAVAAAGTALPSML